MEYKTIKEELLDHLRDWIINYRKKRNIQNPNDSSDFVDLFLSKKEQVEEIEKNIEPWERGIIELLRDEKEEVDTLRCYQSEIHLIEKKTNEYVLNKVNIELLKIGKVILVKLKTTAETGADLLKFIDYQIIEFKYLLGFHVKGEILFENKYEGIIGKFQDPDSPLFGLGSSLKSINSRFDEGKSIFHLIANGEYIDFIIATISLNKSIQLLEEVLKISVNIKADSQALINEIKRVFFFEDNLETFQDGEKWNLIANELNKNGLTKDCTGQLLECFFCDDFSNNERKIVWMSKHGQYVNRSKLFTLIYAVRPEWLNNNNILYKKIMENVVYGSEEVLPIKDNLKSSLSTWKNKSKANEEKQQNRLISKIPSLKTLTSLTA